MHLLHILWPLALALLAKQCCASSSTKRDYATHDYFVLEHRPLTGASLEECTEELGVEIVEQVGNLRDIWLVRSIDTPSSSVSARSSVLVRYETLRARAASSEPSFWGRSDIHQHARRISSSIPYLEKQTLRRRSKRDDTLLHRAPPPSIPSDQTLDSTAVAALLDIPDPLFPSQWHIVNNDFPENMMNVTGLWGMGITGKEVITSIVDDGLDYKSKDLAENFVRRLA